MKAKTQGSIKTSSSSNANSNRPVPSKKADEKQQPPQQPQQQRQQKHLELSRIAAELTACSSSYWCRKSKLAIITSQLPHITPLISKLLEFDVALHFREANDIIDYMDQFFQLHAEKEKEVHERVSKLMRILIEEGGVSGSHSNDFLSKLLGSNNDQPGGIVALLEKHFNANPPTAYPAKERLRLYQILILHKPSLLGTLAMSVWKCFISVRNAPDENAKSDADDSPQAVDLFLFSIAQSLMNAKFGNLDVTALRQLYRIVIKFTLDDSLGYIPEEFYERNQFYVGSLTTVAGELQSPQSVGRHGRWKFCVEVLLASLRLSGDSHGYWAMLKQFPQASLLQITQAAMAGHSQEKAALNAAADSDFLMLLMAYAFASTERMYNSGWTAVYTPAGLYAISPNSVKQRLLRHNEEDDEDMEQRKPISVSTILIPLGNKNHLGGDWLEGLSIINTVLEKYSPSNDGNFASLLATLNPKRPFVTVVQALIQHGKFKQASELIREILGKTLANSPPEQRLHISFQHLQCFLAMKCHREVVKTAIQLMKELGNGIEDDDDQIPKEQFPVVTNNSDCFSLMHLKQMRPYILLCLFTSTFALYAAAREQHSKKQHVSAAKSLFIALVLICQEVWRDVGYALLPQLLEHLPEQKEPFTWPKSTTYPSNPLIVQHLLQVQNRAQPKEEMKGEILAQFLHDNSTNKKEEEPIWKTLETLLSQT